MRWLCLFLPCRWLWVTDVADDHAQFVGLWQCSRCKELSIGRIYHQH